MEVELKVFPAGSDGGEGSSHSSSNSSRSGGGGDSRSGADGSANQQRRPTRTLLDFGPPDDAVARQVQLSCQRIRQRQLRDAQKQSSHIQQRLASTLR